MKDESDPSLDALFASARASAPDTERLEFGFETRLAARLRADKGTSLFAWAWRLCPFFAMLALAVAWWSVASQRADEYARFAAEAAPANDELIAYMTGSRP
jgi:hypothetical protein